ncbi:purine-nucleoside phosphorylase [Rothia sp. ZJ932]|uniref:purine-nucleoside phosphorylase n=1 Tax=Rothia sp. ZJ932 TaxID=2810516 RepID=UPI0019686486|nr:purine-nucleoside phosphorylase [Rothia sp. ZJ932]QRZ61053.1 purine-nucleoside phosphorylase [Rothia sp. ZJ932]
MSSAPLTPHIDPKGAPIAQTVLLPGDPLRAQFIAENYLTNVVQINSVRNMFGYTGDFNGKQITVMGSGMGVPSASLYTWELINVFGVKRIIRIGSCGGMDDALDTYDIVVAASSSTDSNFMSQYKLPGTFAPTASWSLLSAIAEEAKKQNVPLHVGNVLTSDVFYRHDPSDTKKWADMGVLAVEMESAGIYATAAAAGAEALAVFTVSDHIFKGTETTAKERQNAFTTMMELVLPVAAEA